MTHDTPAHYDSNGMLTQMRSILNQFNDKRREIDDANIYVGLMLVTLEELWETVRRSDIKKIDGMSQYQVRACAAVIGDLCKQPNWDNASDAEDWDTYSQTIMTLQWLVELFDE